MRSVLLVRMRVGLGDLLCSMPAVRALRRARPDLRIAMTTWAETRPIIERMRGDVDELLPFPGYPGIPERPPQAAQWAEFVAQCRERRFGLAVQMYGDRAAANDVTCALGARLVGGFAPAGWTPERPGWWLPYPCRVHETWRHLLLLQHLGIPVQPADAALSWPETAGDVREWAEIAAGHGLRAGEYAVVHPGATSASRRWPTAKYAAVVDALADRGLVVTVTGVREEQPLADAIHRHSRSSPVDLVARTTLGSFAALLRRAAIVVSNDTGTAHLAAAVRSPSVTLFMSGDPVRWAHHDPRHALARADVECSPCAHLECPIDFRCADRLLVADVVSRVRSVLEGPARRT